jgi:transcriptional regulator with XRE-family HTH domain
VDAPAESAVTASFGGLLRQYRAAIGLTQEELAERAELSVRGLRYLERDLRRPYRDTAQRLAESLRLEPAECTRLIGAARARTATLVTQSELAGRRALPVPPGPLIGREHELRAVSDLVRRDDVRLVTLTGVGGVGKSRLALGVAAGLHPDFSDVIAWVSLVGLNEPNLVPSAIAQTLGLVATGSVTVQHALRRWFANREVLLL